MDGTLRPLLLPVHDALAGIVMLAEQRRPVAEMVAVAQVGLDDLARADRAWTVDLARAGKDRAAMDRYRNAVDSLPGAA
jgi:antitoxin (DNA-binding transcriptional repressor) of toxin-antitoxin stability system